MNLLDNATLPTALPANPAHSLGPQDGASNTPDTATTPQGPAFGQIFSDFRTTMHANNPGEDTPLTPIGVNGLLAHGQKMADPVSGLNTPWSLLAPGLTNHAGLQAISLGPHLNAITPLSSEPDPQSLEAFARAQGLNEQAINWLFSGANATPGSAAQATGMESGTAPASMAQTAKALLPNGTELANSTLVPPDPSTGNLPMGPSNSQGLQAQQAALTQLPQRAELANSTLVPPDPSTGNLPMGPSTSQGLQAQQAALVLRATETGQSAAAIPGTESATLQQSIAATGLMPASKAQTPAEQSPSQAVTLPSAPNALSNVMAPASHPGLAAPASTLTQTGQQPVQLNADGSAGEDAAALLKLMSTATLWAQPDAKATRPAVPPNTTNPQDQELQASMLRMPPPAATWMQRLAQASPAPSLQKAQTENAVSVSELDLGADFGLELLDTLSAEAPPPATSAPSQDLHNGTNQSHTGSRNERLQSPNPAPAAPMPTPDSAQRSETIQNLADKMGQAVGQRILSEMEKGQWHLKLQLRPATLGHIEVEMRMRSGEFDAVFTAPQALTRDLLQDGLSRLKDTLSAMGMDVANIQVGNGKSNNTGGNSTPGQGRQTASAGAKSDQPNAVEAPTSQRSPQRPNGLDVMV
jgi:flagellar hook-length control protein FliK